MLQSLQRLFRHRAPADAESTLMADWAHTHGDACKRARNGQGAIVRYRGAAGAVRMEWGPPQRSYIRHRELRLRIDARLPPPLEMLIITRAQAEQLEAQAYAALVDQLQTEIDDSLPEEGRWLSTFERVEFDAPADFHERFVVVAASAVHARAWVQGEMVVRLMRAQSRWLAADAPMVLMTLRGRVYLRTDAGTLDETLLDGVRSLGDAAALRARRISQRSGRGGADEAAVAREPVSPAEALATLEVTEHDTQPATLPPSLTQPLEFVEHEPVLPRQVEATAAPVQPSARARGHAGLGVAAGAAVAGLVAAGQSAASQLAGAVLPDVTCQLTLDDFSRDELLSELPDDLPDTLPPLDDGVPTDLTL